MPFVTRLIELQASRSGNQRHPRVQISVEKRAPYPATNPPANNHQPAPRVLAVSDKAAKHTRNIRGWPSISVVMLSIVVDVCPPPSTNRLVTTQCAHPKCNAANNIVAIDHPSSLPVPLASPAVLPSARSPEPLLPAAVCFNCPVRLTASPGHPRPRSTFLMAELAFICLGC